MSPKWPAVEKTTPEKSLHSQFRAFKPILRTLNKSFRAGKERPPLNSFPAVFNDLYNNFQLLVACFWKAQDPEKISDQVNELVETIHSLHTIVEKLSHQSTKSRTSSETSISFFSAKPQQSRSNPNLILIVKFGNASTVQTLRIKTPNRYAI